MEDEKIECCGEQAAPAPEAAEAAEASEQAPAKKDNKKLARELLDLQKKLVEYEVQQKALQQEITKPERDTVFIDVIQKRIDTLYQEIMADPVFMALN